MTGVCGLQVIFTEIIAVFRALLKISRHKQELADNTQVIRQWNSLWSLLARKVDTERKYINKLEGIGLPLVPSSRELIDIVVVFVADKASDKSAKRATEKAYVASHQLVELGDLFEELAVEPADFVKYAHQMVSSPPNPTNSKKKKKAKKELDVTYEDWRYEATEWRPKNMIAKEKLTQLRTTGLPEETSVVSSTQKKNGGGYMCPKDRRRLRVLSNDMEAEALEERMKLRLMSDYRRKPVVRTGSLAPVASSIASPNGQDKRTSVRPSGKINRSTSLAPISGIPRVGGRTTRT